MVLNWIQDGISVETPKGVCQLDPERREGGTVWRRRIWERLYPQVRRELMRRYPKHA